LPEYSYKTDYINSISVTEENITLLEVGDIIEAGLTDLEL